MGWLSLGCRANWMVIFPIVYFFSKKKGFFFQGVYLGRPTCLGLGSLAMRAALAFAATLILAVYLCRGYFPMGAIMALGACTWACHVLGSVPTGAALAFASYLWVFPWLWLRA